ncbi:MAG: Spy/CpxP family protein refolding chaperone, partial [Rhodospirillales bacterium]
MKNLTAIAMALGLAVAGGPVFAQQAADPHHPGGQPPAAAAQTPQPGPGMGMMGGQGMMGMMGGQGMMGGMPMMQGGMMGGQGMMGMMHGGGQGAMAIGPGKHVEGRLAFLRAEIGITAAQTPQWNAFADAVRKANKDMMAAMPMMQQPQDGKTEWPKALERREKAMTAHLEGVRAVRAAVGPLYA